MSGFAIITPKTQIADGPNLDSFGRLRVSSPFTHFDQSLEYGTGQLFWGTATSGAASAVTHDGNTSNAILTCGTEANASVARQTLQYFFYFPGKSRFVLCTGAFGAPAANVTRRYGYYDPQNGYYLEQNGTVDYAIVERSYVTGSVVNNRIPQASWNLDKLDGTGPSGITMDVSKMIIFIVDLQWLGAGRVRVGFDVQGQIVYVHQFMHAGLLATPYMTTASLPCRYEIFNTGVQGSTHTLRQGCVAVFTEDGDGFDRALYFSVNDGVAGHSVTTRRAVLSIRPVLTVGPSAKVNRIRMEPIAQSIMAATNDALVELVWNPVFTGTPVWSAVATTPANQASMEYSIHADAAAGAITGGIVVHSLWVPAGGGGIGSAVSVSSDRVIASKLPVTLDMNGANPIAFSLVVTSRTGTSSVWATMDWKEFR